MTAEHARRPPSTVAIVLLKDCPLPGPSSKELLQVVCDALASRSIRLVEPIGQLPCGSPEAVVASDDVKLCISARTLFPRGQALLCLDCHAPWTAPPGVCMDELDLEDTVENRFILEKLSSALGQLEGAAKVLWFDDESARDFLDDVVLGSRNLSRPIR